MSHSRKNSGITLNLRSLLPDFFDTEQFNLEHLLKREDGPAVNIIDNEKSYEVEVAAPGCHKEDFKIHSKNGILTISVGSKEDDKKKSYLRREHSYHPFTRSFNLPQDAKEEDIKAHYENGVLKLVITKTADAVAQGRHISVS